MHAAPITDNELRALMLKYPEGITTQGIVKELGQRIKNPEVKAALVASLKRMTTQVSSKDAEKKKMMVLKDEYK